MKPALATVTRTVPVIACDGVARPIETASSVRATQLPRILFMRAALFRGGPKRRRLTTVAKSRQGLRAHELQALHGVVAMDLLHIELAHEVDGFLSDDLSWHHDREAGRIRDDKARRDQVGAVLQTT